MKAGKQAALSDYVRTAIYGITSIGLVVGTASVYSTQNNLWSYFNIVTLSITLLVSLPSLAGRGNKFHFDVHSIMIFSLYYVLVFLLLIFGRNTTRYFVYSMIILFPLIYLLCKVLISVHEIVAFIRVFVTVCVSIAAVSLAIWIVGSILHIIYPTGTFLMSWGDETRAVNTYWGIYFETQGNSMGFSGINLGVRNSAIFAEAPMACFIFSSASLLNDVLLNNKVFRVVLLATVLSTLTTTGFIFFLLTVTMYVINMHPRQRALQGVKLVAVPTCMVVAVFPIFSLFEEKGTTGSGIVRSGKMSLELEAFFNFPLFGNGFNSFTNGSSNSLISLLADGGILLWLIFYGPIIYRLGNLLYNKTYDKIAPRLIFLFVFSITVVQYTPALIFVLNVLFIDEVHNIQLKEIHGSEQ